jgi:hypothetical protein
MVDLLAPGSRITGAGLGGSLATYVGTSQASPTAAGVAALMLQADPGLGPAQIEQLLKTTGVPLVDSKNGLSFPRINALAAVQAALAQTPRLLTGRVDLQARADDAGTRVTVGLWEAYTDSDGAFSLSLAPGPYAVSVARPGYLTSETTVNVNAVAPSTAAPPVLLLGGDGNVNGEVDLADLVVVAANYGQASPPADRRADLNGDGNVGLYDLTLVGANYGLSSPQPWGVGQAAASRLSAVGDKTQDPHPNPLPEGEGAKGGRGVVVDVPEKVAAGQVFSVTIRLNQGKRLMGADIQLDYDPTRLVLVDTTPGKWLDPLSSFVARNGVMALGRYRFAATPLGYADSIDKAEVLLTLRFRALADGVPNIDVVDVALVEASD